MRQSRRTRRMARHHSRLGGAATLRLVSLMDIFTILVFFLMVNSSEVEVMQNNASIRLPESVAEQKPKVTLVVTVNNRDIVVQGRPVATVDEAMASGDAFIAPLKKELEYQASRTPLLSPAEKTAGRAVTIMGDRAIPYRLLKKIMVTCTQANYTNISLAVNQKEG